MHGLVERDTELATIVGVVGAAGEGHGGTLLIEGPAGIGKSRLLNATAQVAGEQQLRCLTARGGELERDFAHGVVRQLLEQPILHAPTAERRRLLDGAAALSSAALGLGQPSRTAQADPPLDAAFAVAHGLYWAVANLAEAGPLVLCVDDAHWVDSPSLRFLSYLARRVDSIPVLLVATIRTDEPEADQGLLAELRAGWRCTTLRPGGLSADGTAAVAETELEAPVAPAFAAACRDAVGGNPFLLGELLSSLRTDGVAPDEAGARRVGELGPRSVSSWILGRVARLGHADAVSLARATSVLGNEAELSHAAQIAGLTLDDAARAADALASVGILSRGIPLTFTHPIVRAAIYRDLPPGELALAHRRAAELLRAQGARAERLAPHLLAVPPGGDQTVVAELRSAAAGALSRGAPDLGSRYLARAAAEPPVAEQSGQLLVELGWAQILGGGDAPEGARNIRVGLERIPDAAIRAPQAVRLGRAVCIVEGPAAAVAVLEAERARLEHDGADADLLLGLEVEAASTALLDERTAAAGAARLDTFADLAGHTAAERLGLIALALHGAFTGKRTAAEVADIARRGVADGAFLADHGPTAPPIYMALYALIASDAVDTARALADGAVAMARREGSAMGTRAAMTLRALLSLGCGDLVDAEADARSGLEAEGADEAMSMMTRWVLAGTLMARGSAEEAHEVVACACTPALPNVAHFNPAFWVRGALRLQAGDAAGALTDVEEMLDRNARMGVVVPFVAWWPVATRALLALDRADEARELAAEGERAARSWGAASAVGVALQAHGEARDDPELLREAVDVLAASPARLEHARALIAFGSALRRAGHRSQARDVLRDGLDAARGCGAVTLTEQAFEELKVAGARPRRLQFSGVDALTASERRVAAMAAEGLANREIAQALFVTSRTVETHLANAYRKLGIGSRGELPTALAAPAR